MRVLHVNQRAGFLGGVERILHDTAASLAAGGWPQALLHEDVEPDAGFIAPFEHASSDPDVLRSFQPDVVLVHKTEQVDRIAELSRSYSVARMIHDHDLVCLRKHKYLPLSGRLCERAAGSGCYLRLCFIQRAQPGATVPIRLRSLGAQHREMNANRAVRRYIVGSRWMQGQLEKNGFPAARIDVIHPIPRALESVRPIPASGNTEILYVGQVVRGKGVDLLLRALARLSGGWNATVVGDGNHLSACRQLAAELGIAERVRFTGLVDHERLEAFYSAARFTVMPSRWPEPFGMVGPEAMARGRPVVAFATGGIPDWLDDGVSGLLVPPGDVARFASAMQRLLGDDELVARLGESAARRLQQKLTHHAYLDSLKLSLEATR